MLNFIVKIALNTYHIKDEIPDGTYNCHTPYLLTGYRRCKAEGVKAYFLYFEPLTTQEMWYPVSRYVKVTRNQSSTKVSIVSPLITGEHDS